MKVFISCIIIGMQLFAQPLTVEIEELATQNQIQAIKKTPTVLMVDDFEDSDLIKFREWWTFDKVLIKTKPIEEKNHFLDVYPFKLMDHPIIGMLEDLAYTSIKIFITLKH